MNDIDSEIEQAEQSWVKVPDVTREESPETAMAVKAHNCFVEQITLASAIKKRRTELGLDGELTREKLDGIKTINGMCRKANGDIDRISEGLKEDALKWQKAVNKRKNELKQEVAAIQVPMANFIELCKAEDARVEREAAEAETQHRLKAERDQFLAEQAVRDAQRAAEAEANRKQAEANRREEEILVAARAVLLAEQQKLDEGRRELEAAKAASAKIERDRIAAEEAEKQRLALEEAERFQAQQAAERLRLRQEALEPDLPKMKRFAAAINLTELTAPEVADPEAEVTMRWAREHLKRIAAALLNFGQPKEK